MLDLRVFLTLTRSPKVGWTDQHSPSNRFSKARPQKQFALVMVFACAGSAAAADWRQEIGYTTLMQRLAAERRSAGIVQIAQIEMPSDEDGDYLPDSRDAQLSGTTINDLSGAGGISNHATIVGQYCMGLTSSLGGGVRLVLDSYEANNWAGGGLLMVNTNRLPKIETRRVQNHSWIGTFGSEC